MKWFTIIHLLVSVSSNGKIIKIWIIVNFIRIYDQVHVQFSIVSYLLFKNTSIIFLSMSVDFFHKYLYLKVNSPIVCSALGGFNCVSSQFLASRVRADCRRQCVWISEECPGVGYRRLGAGLSEYFDSVSDQSVEMSK